MKVVMGVSERITVLDHGEKIAEGTPQRCATTRGSSRPTSGSRTEPPMALLEVDDIHTYYGNIEALKGISLEVEEGEIVTLIGSNGAGKSTTLRSISGLTPAARGLDPVRRQGASRETPPQEIVRLGISQSPEGRRCFSRMTVRENLELGAYLRATTTSRTTSTASTTCSRACKEREKQKAGTMSGGEQQMLAIGRALMAEPRLLLLDEPSMGLAPILVERIYETIREINEQGTTILLVEQNANSALDVVRPRLRARDGHGRAHRRVLEAEENPEVQKAYLGMLR